MYYFILLRSCFLGSYSYDEYHTFFVQTENNFYK